MAQVGQFSVDAAEIVKGAATLNVRFSGLRRLRWRLKIGSLVIRFGCWIASVGCRMEEAPD